jgi:CheY-like chemotaxis protein
MSFENGWIEVKADGPLKRGMTLRVRGNGTKRRRLLILDDEALVLRALARALGREYEVTVLSSPEEALLRLASGDSWDAILSDVMMPEMNGVEFARRAVATRPELAGRLVLMTGGASMPGTCTLLEKSGLPVITKPFDITSLRALLATISSGPP